MFHCTFWGQIGCVRCGEFVSLLFNIGVSYIKYTASKNLCFPVLSSTKSTCYLSVKYKFLYPSKCVFDLSILFLSNIDKIFVKDWELQDLSMLSLSLSNTSRYSASRHNVAAKHFNVAQNDTNVQQLVCWHCMRRICLQKIIVYGSY